jgi:hypothetical protein
MGQNLLSFCRSHSHIKKENTPADSNQEQVAGATIT